MAVSLEERLFTAERLIAALLRERSGVATDGDLRLLENAGAAFGRMVHEPAPAAAAPPARAPLPPPPPAPRRPAPAWQPAAPDAYDDLVPGPRHRHTMLAGAELGRERTEPFRNPVAMEPTAAERWVKEKLNATPGDWIARAGMALLLLGIAFLCKYSIDQGWITPALRVSAGAAAGAVLVGLGIRTQRTSRPFSALFLGGGIGAWYIATYAAYEMYHLLPFPVAFALMAATTAAAFGLAMWSGLQVLAVVGTLGGLATPFVLTTPNASVPGLVAYLMCILAWSSGAYLAWRWRTSFVVGAVGTWLALATAVQAVPAGGAATTRAALTAGFVAVLLAGWGVFNLPAAWPARFPPTAGERGAHAFWARAMQLPAERIRVVEGYLAVLLSFCAAWSSLGTLWQLGQREAGYLGAAVAGVTVLAFAALRGRAPALARANALVAAGAGAISLVLVSRDLTQVAMVLAVYGTLLHACARREPLGRPVRLLAHAVMLAAAVAILQPLATPDGLAVRLALVAAAACAYAVARQEVSGVGRPGRDGYRLAGHAYVAVLLWALCWGLAAAGGWLAVSLAAFAAALCLLERQPEGGRVLAGRPVDGTAALALYAVGVTTLLGFCGAFGAGAVAWFNERAAAELAMVASLATAAALAAGERRRQWLAGAAYVLWLFAAADQFDGVTGGAALTTGAWAATGLALLLTSLRVRQQDGVRLTLGTLALVCAKLFLVDLANLEPVWRILLFIGVGIAFLAVSYYVRTAWLADSAPPADSPERVSLAG
jgi:uncharacterized membrane protein